jgi:hypothetical protein
MQANKKKTPKVPHNSTKVLIYDEVVFKKKCCCFKSDTTTLQYIVNITEPNLIEPSIEPHSFGPVIFFGRGRRDRDVEGSEKESVVFC